MTSFFTYILSRRIDLSHALNSPSLVTNFLHGVCRGGGNIDERTVILDTEYMINKNYITLK